MYETSFVFGVDHKLCPVDLRENLAKLAHDDIHQVLKLASVEETTILSTCNRFEIYGQAKCPAIVPMAMSRLLDHYQIPSRSLQQHAYHKVGRTMVEHGFKVAASLESMVVGENQILGQMKEAYSRDKQQGHVKNVLDRYFNTAFKVGKRVRTETAIASDVTSVASAAVKLAKEIHGDLTDKSVLLIGAGQMCQYAADNLKRAGVRHVSVINRSPDRAAELAQLVGAKIYAWCDIEMALENADIVISSTGATQYVVTAQMMHFVMRRRKQKPIFMIDIAVPRDIDPKIHKMDNLYLYDIDHLQNLFTKAQENRTHETEAAYRIVEAEVEGFIDWTQSQRQATLVKEIREHFEQQRQEILKENLSAEEATRKLMNKMLHGPTVYARNLSDLSEGRKKEAMLRKMFALEK